ncbi:hypothetical protein COV21_01705 [Candidatus Woesearchaeota archaeon CG10_big_fil_rev_8_21_14_0_10_45_5]|nr:MAG: hypothetical protein COV21_01705 [Candidatus Woesearchaeota archaeon CG10_big_fil_rev_8_21_14_0_10_45_5]PIU29752.1 MAG: DUF424 domain-containing protein [Candidatus Woesearchaeota archaeon CG07_land_8_20_14_0_80_44_23]
MIAKQHKTENGTVLAVVDEKLAGKKFEEGRLQLDLSADFYNGEKVSEEELLQLMKSAYIINITGKKSVEIAIRNNFIEKDAIIVIAGIPHAQCVILRSESFYTRRL